MRINTNVNSLTAQANNQAVNKGLNSSLEKLSSGLRINKASDDSSGMAIADKLRTQASGLGQSISNANSGIALVQIADKAMAEQSNILDIVKTKLIQASTSTTSEEGREAIRKDVNKLLEQLDAIAETTNYNGINLLNEKNANFNFQVGEKASYDIDVVTAYKAHTTGLGGGANTYTDGNVTLEKENDAIQLRDSAVGAFTIKSDTNNSAAIADISFSLSGNNITQLDASALSFTVADTKTKEILLAATANTAALSYNSATDVFTLTSALNFSADGGVTLGTLTFTTAAGATGKLDTAAELTVGSSKGTIQIVNLDANTAGETAQADINIAATATMTGGNLLSELKALKADELTNEVANKFMTSIDEALNQLNAVRSDFGSAQNQLDSFVRSASVTQTNIRAAESVIRDVDYAAESANFNKQNIVAQAGTYAMSQANSIQQNVMRLLQ